MIGPTKRPQDFGFSKNDSHLIVNDVNETIKGFNSSGTLLWTLPCLARGQYGDTEWRYPKADTPPSLYKLGTCYQDDIDADNTPLHIKKSFGWLTFQMIDLQGILAQVERDGICLHGGGSACGWPGAWEPMQELYTTHGCVRMHNKHLREYIFPLWKLGTVYVSVYQES